MPRRRFLVIVVFALSLTASEHKPLATAVDSIGITVSDLDRAVAFYTDVLTFEKVTEFEAAGEALEHATGVFGARTRTARLRLGEEFIELTEYLAPRGKPFPLDSRGNDRWFQHIALIVSDMDQAYKRLRAYNVQHASTGPQRLPDWNPNAGGIEAFYFRDPDGHYLEVLAFPPDKGNAKWHAPSTKLFLGIDHTAIVISNTEASLRFYRGVVGLDVTGASENYGTEQEHLNNVFGARLKITALRAASGPGIELLEYLAPGDGRPFPLGTRSNDLIHWQTRFLGGSADEAARQLQQARSPLISSRVVTQPDGSSGYRKSVLARDPDGHAVQFIER
jgi:catechol 2,3-dioxygenase-like lactoylglutathione lyase family enzyme